MDTNIINKSLEIQENTLIGKKEVPTINARDLHEVLGSSRQFGNWIKHKIKYCGLEEEFDFITSVLKSTGGRPKIDYIVELRAGKHIALSEGTAIGRQYRDYLLNLEEKFYSMQDHSFCKLRESRETGKLLITDKVYDKVEIILSSQILSQELNKAQKREIQQSITSNFENIIKDDIIIELEEGMSHLLTTYKIPIRDRFNKLARSYAYKDIFNDHQIYPDIYNAVYDEFEKRFKMNLWQLAKEEGVSIIDWLDQNNLLDKALDIMNELLLHV